MSRDMTERAFRAALKRNGFRFARLFWFEDTTGQASGVLFSGAFNADTSIHRRETIRHLIARREAHIARERQRKTSRSVPVKTEDVIRDNKATQRSAATAREVRNSDAGSVGGCAEGDPRGLDASSLVALAPEKVVVFRTLDGLTVVGIEDTHYCRGCDGLGSKRGRPCGSCKGSGRLLGADPFVWPVPVVLVEDTQNGAAPGTTGRADSEFANDRRAPLPRAGAGVGG